MLVRVLVRKPFELEGIRYVAGEFAAIPPLDAALLSRQGVINLSRQNIQTRELTPEPVPVPVRRRRSYKRADMTAETPE